MKPFKVNFYVYIVVLGSLLSCSSDDVQTDDLEEQLNTLVALSESVTCIDSNDWQFAGIGSKPCGGPTGYIAYSNAIDTVDFLSRLAAYNEAVRAYNESNGLPSDCALLNPPTRIECEDGKAVLVYQEPGPGN
ncbi:hypothetical protein FGF1_12520 [Flavobacteriaceae bacterium GF1]